MRKIALTIIALAAISCKNDPQTTSVDQIPEASPAFQQKIEMEDVEVELLPDAKDEVIKWLEYITAQNEIDNLKGASLNRIIETSKPLSEIMQSLQNTMPKTLKAAPVDARVNVLVTKAKVLEQLSNRRKLDTNAITTTARQIPIEFNNFKLQINELYLKTLEDFEKELDEFEQNELKNTVTDSVPERLR